MATLTNNFRELRYSGRVFRAKARKQIAAKITINADVGAGALLGSRAFLYAVIRAITKKNREIC